MREKLVKSTLVTLIHERLAALGAANIPATAKSIIEADVLAAVAALVERRVTAPMIGRAVARGLAAGATKLEGCKGDLSPLPSSDRARSAQGRVAGLPGDASNTSATEIADEASEHPKGGAL